MDRAEVIFNVQAYVMDYNDTAEVEDIMRAIVVPTSYPVQRQRLTVLWRGGLRPR